MQPVRRLPAYLASPYSAIASDLTPDQKAAIREARYQQALKASHWLIANTWWVYSPIVHCHEIAKLNGLPTDAKFWKEFNEAMIDSFQSVIVLCEEGWSISKGVTMEIEYAKDMHCDLWYLVPSARVNEELREGYLFIDHAPLNTL